MKCIFILLLTFFSFLIKNENDGQVYTVLQYSVTTVNNIIIKFNVKCYKSTFSKKIKRQFLYIKTDSVEIKYHIIKNESDGHLLSKDKIPYVLKIISKNGDYYMTIAPFKFNHKYLYQGDAIAISNKEICQCK